MQDPLKYLQKDVAAFLRATSPGVEDPLHRKRGGQPGKPERPQALLLLPRGRT